MSGISLTNSGGNMPSSPSIEFIQGDDGIDVPPDPSTFIIKLLGDNPQGVFTSGDVATNTETITVQDSTAAATSGAASKGVASFNSANFSDVSGYVSIINGGFQWIDKAADFNANPQEGYFCTGNLTATLPVSPSQGNTIIIYVDASITVKVQCSGTQRIQVGESTSTSGGFATSSPIVGGSSLTLVYRAVDNNWHSTSIVGNWPVSM